MKIQNDDLVERNIKKEKDLLSLRNEINNLKMDNDNLNKDYKLMNEDKYKLIKNNEELNLRLTEKENTIANLIGKKK